MKVTLKDLQDVLNKEIVFGFQYTLSGSKKITYNPTEDVTRIYSNEIIIYTDVDKERAIEKYNELLV